MPAERRPLGFKCPRCGRKYGSVMIKKVSQTQKIPTYKVKKDFLGVEQMIPVKRNLHAYKYNTLFGDIDPNRKPIINPPEPKQGERPDVYTEKIEKFMKGFFLNLRIFPLVLEKYPELIPKSEGFFGGLKVLLKYIKPIIDGRWDRSWAEWAHIIEYAKVHGYNAASRRFPALKNGKEEYLSPEHIREKIKEFDALIKQAEKIYPGSHNYIIRLKEIIKNDNDLKEKYIQLAREYDENKIQIMSHTYNSNVGSKVYLHIYYYIRHYDPNVYQRRKSDYEKGLIKKKSQVTGRVECGPFKEKDFPVEAIERLRLQTPEGKNIILLYSKILFILSFQPFTSLWIQHIIETETKDIIKSMLEELRIDFGLVIRLSYSDYKPGMTNGLNESSAVASSYINANGDDDNLFYLLNWSNPNSKEMLADYQKKSTKGQRLNIIKKISEHSRKATSVYNEVEVKQFLTNIENTENSNVYPQGIEDVLELAKCYKENGKSPLLALIDLKSDGIFFTKVKYVDIWEAMEKAGLL
jgi:hypothetical protein